MAKADFTSEITTGDGPARDGKTDEQIKDDIAFLQKVRERFDACTQAEAMNRGKAEEDLLMRAGDQWPEDVLKERNDAKRPALTFPQQGQYIDVVIGNYRQNRPQIRVRCPAGASPDLKITAYKPQAQPKATAPVPGGGGMPGTLGGPPAAAAAQAPTAIKPPKKYGYHEVMAGIVRNIEDASSADIAYDYGVESAVACGQGHWRILAVENEQDPFGGKSLFIRSIDDPFSVHWDPAATQYDRTDANFCFVEGWVDKDEFEERYPGKKADPAQLSSDGLSASWFNASEHMVRVCEYFLKVEHRRPVHLMSDDRILEGNEEFEKIKDELAAQGVTVIDTKQALTHAIQWYCVSAAEILEGPITLDGRYIPVVSVYGKQIWNAKHRQLEHRSVIRPSHDAQRAYNYERTAAVEQVALAPKSPFIVVMRSIKNYLSKWNTANRENHPYLPVDVEPGDPLPQRSQPPQASSGHQQGILMARDDIRGSIGMYQAALGERSNETTGKAIRERKDTADVMNTPFLDNAGRSIAQTGRILVDLIPRTYDTRRMERILFPDGSEDVVVLNETVTDEQTGQTVTVHDLSQSLYLVSVDIGPSFKTRREEAAAGLERVAAAIGPEGAAVISDLMVGSLDFPGATEAAKRLRRTIPPNITAPDAEEGEPVQPDPNLVIQQQMQTRETEVEQLKYEAERTDAEARKLEAEARLRGQEDVMRKIIAEEVAAFMSAAAGTPPAPPPVEPQLPGA